jgi:hypothetical protein
LAHTYTEYGSSNGSWRDWEGSFNHRGTGWEPRRSFRVARKTL